MDKNTISDPSIGERLKSRRLNAGLTIEELAELLSVEADIVSRIESGDARPGREFLAELSRALDCHVHDLVGRQDGTAQRSKDPWRAFSEMADEFDDLESPSA